MAPSSRGREATPGPPRTRVELLPAIGADHDQKCSSAAAPRRCCSPRRSRTSACASCWTRWSSWRHRPPPPPRRGAPTDAARGPRRGDPFSGLVFKVQAGMDPSHRDRMAFVRVCSGRFERGMVVTHAQTGRPFATKYAQAVFGQERAVSTRPTPATSSAWSTRPRCGRATRSTPTGRWRSRRSPSFAPEHFAVATRSTAAGTSSSGAGSSSSTARASCRCCARTCAASSRRCWRRSARCSSRSPSPGWRPSSAPIRLEPLGYTLARRTDAESAAELGARARGRGVGPQRRRPAGARSRQVADRCHRARPPRAHPRTSARRRPLTASDRKAVVRRVAGSPPG